MIYSMTGFGRGITGTESRKFTVEIKTLNSKQLDLSVRMPSILRELEVKWRPELAARLIRGKVEVNVLIENTGIEAISHLNMDAIRGYKEQLETAANELSITPPQDWYSILLRMPDVLRQPDGRQSLPEADIETLHDALLQAMNNLMEFRRLEGAKLEAFFRTTIEHIHSLLAQVDPYENERIEKIRHRLEEQLARINTPEYDRDRLEQELIFYIEKLDVTEEKTRLRAHLGYFLDTLALPEGGQGKKLGFIAQEIGREINTLGSKANHAEMQKIVVRMKDCLEQIKEQVLNVL